MALKIYWTPQAEKGYDEIINYLAVKWTDREIHHFIEEIMHFLNLLSEIPIYYNQHQHEKMSIEVLLIH